jgi:hypothetical protein
VGREAGARSRQRHSVPRSWMDDYYVINYMYGSPIRSLDDQEWIVSPVCPQYDSGFPRKVLSTYW